MRRFINTLPGRIISQITAFALILPFVSFITATRTEAQVSRNPVLAVVDFENKAAGGAEVGSAVAEAVANEFAKSGKYDVVPQETIKRAYETLGLQVPVTQTQSLIRLSNEVSASTVVSGEMVNWRIRSESGGKRAEVIIYVVVRDVASGLPINGAAVSASSSVRAGSVDDAAVISEAIGAGASEAVRQINARTLPTATVLNTYGKTALINQGARTGFEQNMELVIVRGRDQVATGVVQNVEPDTSQIVVTTNIRGIQPGDKVRAVFYPPKPNGNFTANGGVQVSKPKRNNKAGDFGTLAAVLGIAVILLSGGKSNDNSAVTEFNAEATTYPDFSGQPAVELTWKRDLFARGNYNQVRWQISRSDQFANPVLSVDRNISRTWDLSDARDVTWADFAGRIGGNTCDFAAEPSATADDVPGVVSGRPYTYEIQLVYRIEAFNLPGASATTGTTGGTTGGLTTGGGTTGTTATTGGTTGGLTTGTTGTTGTTATTGGTGTTGGTAGGSDCYFISPRQLAKGIATPLIRVPLVSPASSAVVSTNETFTFTSVVNPQFPITVEYALQFASDETFTSKKKIKTYAKITRTDIGTLAFVPADYLGGSSLLINKLRADFGSGTQQLFWRVGAHNVADRPGPKKDATGARYIWGAPRRILLPTLPPPPP